MKPNILFMISHDTGRKLQSYGYKVETPELTKLSGEGIQFNQAFCVAPQCSPSRGSILTGLYPHNNGLLGLAHLGFCINHKHTTLPKELQKNGYETTLIGLSHETINEAPPIEKRIFSSTYDLGYDHFVDVPGDRAPQIATEVANFFHRQKDNEKPFYLNVGFFETHRSFDEYRPYADDVSEVEVFDFLPDAKKIREDIALYNGSAKVLDAAIGKINTTLKETGLDKNTIIIYTTDHGVDFPKAKGALKNAGLETALIIVLPESGQKNVKCDALVCNVDLLPTILDLIEAEIPDQLDGKSFAKLLISSVDEEIRESIFTELTWHDRYHPMRSIRTKEFSYVRNFEDGPKIYMPIDAHMSPSGEEVRDECYLPNTEEELYDLRKDPKEEQNVIEHPDYQEIAFNLREKVAKWMSDTDDPLLKGSIPGIGSKRWDAEIEAGRAYREKTNN